MLEDPDEMSLCLNLQEASDQNVINRSANSRHLPVYYHLKSFEVWIATLRENDFRPFSSPSLAHTKKGGKLFHPCHNGCKMPLCISMRP